MAKQIAQETFNNVVLENIQEFEMSPEEAVEDAVKQFEAQGVNLMLLIKDPKMFTKDGMNEESSTENKLDNLLRGLEQLLKISEFTEETLKSCSEICTELQDIFTKGLPERCVATQVGAYKIILNSMQAVAAPVTECQQPVKNFATLGEIGASLLDILLKTFSCYVKSQPDVLDDAGEKLFLSLLRCCSEDICYVAEFDVRIVRTVEVLLEIFERFCFMHEKNRQKLIGAGLAMVVVKILDVCEKSTEEVGKVVRGGCSLLRGLVLDDDVRVAFGQAHEHALIIVNQCDSLPVLFRLLKKFIKNEEVTGDILAAISQLVVREEFCVRVSEMGGVRIVMELLKQHSEGKHRKNPVLKSALQLLKNLSGCDKVKVEAMTYPQGSAVVCEAIERNLSDAYICDIACTLVASLVLRYPDHGRMFVEENAIHDLLRRMMILHEKQAQVQKSGSMAIRNIVSRSPELITPFLEVGMEELLRKALQRHQETCRDEISYALRDLNCQVQLRELWLGTGKNLEQ